MDYSNCKEILQTVPKGYCFVMGDNRNHSTDSRVEEVGLIKYDDIIGKAVLIYYPSEYRSTAFKNPEFYRNVSIFFLVFLILSLIGF